MKKHGHCIHSLTRSRKRTHAHTHYRSVSENRAVINTEKSININIPHKKIKWHVQIWVTYCRKYYTRHTYRPSYFVPYIPDLFQQSRYYSWSARVNTCPAYNKTLAKLRAKFCISTFQFLVSLQSLTSCLASLHKHVNISSRMHYFADIYWLSRPIKV